MVVSALQREAGGERGWWWLWRRWRKRQVSVGFLDEEEYRAPFRKNLRTLILLSASVDLLCEKKSLGN